VTAGTAGPGQILALKCQRTRKRGHTATGAFSRPRAPGAARARIRWF